MNIFIILYAYISKLGVGDLDQCFKKYWVIACKRTTVIMADETRFPLARKLILNYCVCIACI